MAAVAVEVVDGEVAADVAVAAAAVVVVAAVAVVGSTSSIAGRRESNMRQTGTLAATTHQSATAAGKCVKTRPSSTVLRRPFTQAAATTQYEIGALI